MSGRALALPMVAAAAVAALLGGQVAAGGGDYVPARSANPCTRAHPPSASTGLEGLAEEVVLRGLDSTACAQHLSRERLVLQIGDPQQRTTVSVAALRAGLLAAVADLDKAHALPSVSSLANEAVDRSNLPGLVKTAIHAVPDAAIDAAFTTGPLLTRAIGSLDIGKLLGNLEDPAALQAALSSAVLNAARDQIIDDVEHQLPNAIRALLP